MPSLRGWKLEEWGDEEVVVDGNLITSCKPGDMPACNREIIEMFSHAGPEARARARNVSMQEALQGLHGEPRGTPSCVPRLPSHSDPRQPRSAVKRKRKQRTRLLLNP